MRLTWTLPTALVLAMPLAAGAQSSDQYSQPQQEPSQQEQQMRTTQAGTTEVGEIVDNPAAYEGRQVTVSGEVDEVLGNRTFSIGEEGILDVDDSLLVVTKQDQRVSDDGRVHVSGTIRQLAAEDIEREYGVAGWDTEGRFFGTADERRPVLVADQVDIQP